LAESSGLTCSDLARLLGVKRAHVHEALKRLMAKGYVESFPYYMTYYGFGKVYNKPIRIYVLTEAGKAALGFSGKSQIPKIHHTRSFITVDEFQHWSSQAEPVWKASRELWKPFKDLRERLKAKSLG
jgi:predicted ArsR family transcriptional regulator